MISGILSGSMPDRATYAIAVPVQNEGEVVYLLSFLAPVNRLQGILSREYVQGWMTGVSDRDGIALARIPDPASIVGRPRLATLRQRQTDTPESGRARISTCAPLRSSRRARASPGGR